MSALLKKLNFKGQQKILLLNTPEELETEIADFGSYLEIIREVSSEKVDFCLVFVKEKAEIAPLSSIIDALMLDDGLCWWAYPKKTSKNYKSDIGRDTAWESLGKLGYEPVRMIAINSDWSALRFRKIKFIKTLNRNRRISEENR